MKKPGDWWPCYSADTSEVDALRLAAKALGVPEKHIKILRTGGGMWTRVRQEKKQ